ncbi:hypothetical protein TWF970_005009 [Orbilia oligospora]|uniref:Uncharacterized protein n=1 Tax=Orbilia oligospora TaxID=2813651 RepID=A0A7C8R798_ORBOL|nr:hypothetical protein TWF970_005009 [Orbilia oligospora]
MQYPVLPSIISPANCYLLLAYAGVLVSGVIKQIGMRLSQHGQARKGAKSSASPVRVQRVCATLHCGWLLLPPRRSRASQPGQGGIRVSKSKARQGCLQRTHPD